MCCIAVEDASPTPVSCYQCGDLGHSGVVSFVDPELNFCVTGFSDFVVLKRGSSRMFPELQLAERRQRR